MGNAQPVAGPTNSQRLPEQSVDGFYRGPRAFPFKDGELLSQGEDFQRRIGATEEENADGVQGITNEPL
jgi:hypothetical protein